MKTAIRPGKVPFFASEEFPYGLSRSSYFNIRESEELIAFGHTLISLLNGSLQPENNEESRFIEEVNHNKTETLYFTRLWKKYLAAVANRRVFHGFSISDAHKAKTPMATESHF